MSTTNPIYVNTDLRGREWHRAATVARNLRYAFVSCGGVLAGTEYGKIVYYLSRHPELQERVTAILRRQASK